MDFVPGVSQNPPASDVPQVESWLQLPPQLPLSQNATLLVAARHDVPLASMHVGPPLYTLQLPPHTLSTRFVQYVTIVSRFAMSRDASGLSTMGLPWNVRSASVVASQRLNCVSVTRYVAGWLPLEASRAMRWST